MRTSRPVRRALAGAFVTMMLAGTAACGTDEARSPAAGESPTPVVDKREFLASMKEALGESGSAHMTIEMDGAQTMRAEGDMRFGGTSPVMSMTMRMAQLGETPLRILVVDEVVYLSMARLVPQGKFLAIDPTDPNNPLGSSMGELSRQMDPRHTFDAFEAGLRDVKYVGEDDVSGETLDRYRLRVDFAKAAKAQGMPPMEGMPKIIDYHVWLDDEDLMRRVTFDLDDRVSFEATMSDWGKPVSVQAPRPNQVVDSFRMAG